MRIKQADLAAFVSTTLLALRTGVESARAAGLIAELPAKVSFTVDVISSQQSLASVTATAVAGTDATIKTLPNVSEVRTESGGGSTVAETSSSTRQTVESRNGANEQTTTREDNTEGTTTNTETTTETATGTATKTSSENSTQAQNSANTTTANNTGTEVTTKTYL